MDNISISLLKVVRLGHPARVSESIQRLSLDALLQSVDSGQIILDVRKDIKKALVSRSKSVLVYVVTLLCE